MSGSTILVKRSASSLRSGSEEKERPKKKRNHDTVAKSSEHVNNNELSTIYSSSAVNFKEESGTKNINAPSAGSSLQVPLEEGGVEKETLETEIRVISDLKFDACLVKKQDRARPKFTGAIGMDQKGGVSKSFFLRGEWRGRYVLVKCFFQYEKEEKDNSLLVETEIYNKVIRQLIALKYTPNVVYPLASVHCDDFALDKVRDTVAYNAIRENLARLKESTGYDETAWQKFHMLVLENRASMPLTQFITDMNVGIEVWRSILFQLFWTIEVFTRVGLVHQDLHLRNILVEIGTLSEKNLWYQLDEKKWVRCSAKVVAFIIDFDRATYTDTGVLKGTKPLFNTLIQNKFCKNSGQCNVYNNKMDAFSLVWHLKRRERSLPREITPFLTWIMRGDSEGLLQTEWGHKGQLCSVAERTAVQETRLSKIRDIKYKNTCNGPGTLTDAQMRPVSEILSSYFFQPLIWSTAPSDTTEYWSLQK